MQNGKLLTALAAFVVGACLFADVPPQPALIARVASGELSEARASWWGWNAEDATASLQAAIASGAATVTVERMEGPWVVRPLRGASNQRIVFERGVEVVAKKGEFMGLTDCLLAYDRATNVVLSGYGATLRMHRADYDAAPYKKGEWRHCLKLLSSQNVVVEGLTLEESGGDGIYVGEIGERASSWKLPCRDIMIRDCRCVRNYRQGISVISVDGFLVENTEMSDTSGTAPQAGIDFEPNHRDQVLRRCILRNCDLDRNKGSGVEIVIASLDARSEPVDIAIENCRMRDDKKGLAYIVQGKRINGYPTGRISVDRCVISNTTCRAGIDVWNKPADSVALRFSDCKVLDCRREQPEEPDVFLGSIRSFAVTDGIDLGNLFVRQCVDRPWLNDFAKNPCGIRPRAITGTVTVEDAKGRVTRHVFGADTKGGETFDRTKFRIGCFSFNPPAQTPQHVAEAKACGLDYVGGGIDYGKCPVMDELAAQGLAVNGHFLPRVVGNTPARGTDALRAKFPKDELERMLDEFNAKYRHPAIAMMNICDEPPAQSFEFIGDVVRLMKEKCPGVLAYVNLYPSYARVSGSGADVEKSQLGCANYADYIAEYCRKVPTHFIAYDHYPMASTPERTRKAMPRWYGNLKVVADACRATGRDLWVGPQVNTLFGTAPLTENNLRYQAFSSMAFGAVTLTWACWTYGWGTNQVMEADGTLTCQYSKLKKVNAEIHRIAEEYMKYRNAATHFVGFSGEREALSKYGIKPVEWLDASGVTGLAAEDGSALVIGEMTPRDGRGPANALFIYAADDCADERRAEHVVSFASERRPVVFGPDGRREIEAAGIGRWRLTLADNSCALIVMKEK